MLPELRIFAGPNGSGKSTVTDLLFDKIGDYINADDIARTMGITVLEAAQLSDRWRAQCVAQMTSFTSEIVLSSDSKLQLMKHAKHAGFFIKGIFVFTQSVEINIGRVAVRAKAGLHDVPEDKIRSRYVKSLANLPKFITLCDICHVYDNTEIPTRIYKKHKGEERVFCNHLWTEERILTLTNQGLLLE